MRNLLDSYGMMHLQQGILRLLMLVLPRSAPGGYPGPASWFQFIRLGIAVQSVDAIFPSQTGRNLCSCLSDGKQGPFVADQVRQPLDPW